MELTPHATLLLELLKEGWGRREGGKPFRLHFNKEESASTTVERIICHHREMYAEVCGGPRHQARLIQSAVILDQNQFTYTRYFAKAWLNGEDLMAKLHGNYKLQRS